VSELCTDTERGLSTQDAEFRLKRYGKWVFFNYS
jgi:hypothetical protein